MADSEHQEWLKDQKAQESTLKEHLQEYTSARQKRKRLKKEAESIRHANTLSEEAATKTEKHAAELEENYYGED